MRREGHEPAHAAESLEAVDDWVSPEPQPLDHAISAEEKAILWRSLKRIPEIYREPLVLFYREHQSIEAVAQSLDLSEDAVKQRLSRGRKLLQEQVLAFIAAALVETKPDQAFTLGVLAALPLVATTAKAAAATAAIKGGSTFKFSTSLALFGAVLTADLMFELSLFAFLAFTGGCLGYMMGRACARSAGQLQSVTRFWRALAIGYRVFLVLPWLFAICFRLPATSHPGLWHGLTLWLGLFLLYIPAALAAWLWRWGRGLRPMATEPATPLQSLKKQFVLWLALGMMVPAGFTAMALSQMLVHPGPTWIKRTITEAQVQKIITERQDATYSVEQGKSGFKTLCVKLPETRQRDESTLTLLAESGIVTSNIMGLYANGAKTLWMLVPERSRRVEFRVPTDESTLALLDQNGRTYVTTVEGRDFDVLGMPGKLVELLSFFLTPMGALIVLRRPWRAGFQMREIEIKRDERNSKLALKALGVAVAFVLITTAVLFGMFLVRWNVRTLSTADVQKMAASLKGSGMRLTVYQYSDGTRELNFPPNCIAPADAATLAILDENGLSYTTLVQGRDFGYGSPKLGVALLCISLLVVGAGLILWRVSPKALAVAMALMMVAASIPLGLLTRWQASDLPPSEVRQFILAHKNSRYVIQQYSDGTSEIVMGGRSEKHFIGRADEATLALLAENKVTYRTLVQGRDFGFRQLGRGTTMLIITGLGATAAGILWLAWKKKRPLAALAESGS